MRTLEQIDAEQKALYNSYIEASRQLDEEACLVRHADDRAKVIAHLEELLKEVKFPYRLRAITHQLQQRMCTECGLGTVYASYQNVDVTELSEASGNELELLTTQKELESLSHPSRVEYHCSRDSTQQGEHDVVIPNKIGLSLVDFADLLKEE